MCPPADVTLVSNSKDGARNWRPFGQVCALDISFDQADRPRLVSRILEICTPDGMMPSQVWALSLAERLGGLLSIWAQISGRADLELEQPCPAGCGTDLELPLPVAALLDLAREAAKTPRLALGNVTLRRPTGEDQRRWKDAAPREAEAAILADLVTGGAASDIADIAEHLAEFDPLTCFSVLTTCPECDAECAIPVDLEAHVLGLLAGEQTRLFHEIDILARRYGWRDTDILAMPASRRSAYIRIVEQEAGW